MMPDFAAAHDLRRVGIEDAVVVRLAIVCEGLMHSRIGGEARGLEPGFDHAQAAGREDGAAERAVGLQADDDFVVAVDPARRVGEHGGGRRRVDVEHALALLFLEERLQLRPDRLGARRRPDEEGLVALVGRDDCGR